MSDEVNMTTELARLNAEAAKWRHKYRESKASAVKLQAEIEPLKAEFEILKGKASAEPGEVQAELAKLRGELRSNKHKAVLERVAKGLNVSASTEDLVKLMDYKAESDDVDEAALKGLLEQSIKERPWLVGQPEAKKWEAGPGVSKGADNTQGKMIVRMSEVQDPEWMRTNQRRFNDAVKLDNVAFVD